MALTFEETIFIFSLLTLVAVFLYKLYGIMSKTFIKRKIKHKEEKENKHTSMVFLTYIVASLSFGFSFVASMIDFNNTLMRILFRYEIPLFLLITLFFIIELISHFQNKTMAAVRDRYNPNLNI